MKMHRIYAVTIRHLMNIRRNLDRVTDTFYWPVIDLFIWGVTFSYISKGGGQAQLLFVILASQIFWTLTWRTQYEVGVTLLDDMWAKNLVNLFVSPLKFSEWLTSFIVIAAIKSTISFGVAAILGFILYRVGITTVGWYMLPLGLILILNGYAIGFLITSLILRFGARLQSFAWTLGAVITPFAAVYYPVSILPTWAQYISKIIPATYAFESMRQFAYTGNMNQQYLWIGFGLDVLYIILSLFFLQRSFKKLLDRGMITLH